MSGRRPLVGILGGAHAPPHELDIAEELGMRLIDAGCRIVTGGLGGVMAAASRGARSSNAWADGLVIGVLPGLSAQDANEWVDIPIVTGLNYARNVVLVATADVVVAVGGGAGTLSELALAWQHQKHIVAVCAGDGWASRLADQSLDDRREDRVHSVTSARDAVDLVGRLVSVKRPRVHGV